MPHRRALAIAAVVLVVLVGIGVAAHDALAAFGVHRAVAALGYDLSESRLSLGRDSLSLVAPVIRNNAGEPVFAADRLDVRFSLRDLLPGSKARFGLRAVDLERPTLTLIHHADGTYNIALPGTKGPPARPDTTPIDLRLRVRNGTIALIDRFVVPNHERIESLTGVRADAVLSPADPAYYRFDADLQDGARRYPIAGRARFDHRRHFASQHWYAPELPIGPLVDFAITTHAVNLVDGRLRGFDARVYGFIHDDGTTDTHLGASAELARRQAVRGAAALGGGRHARHAAGLRRRLGHDRDRRHAGRRAAAPGGRHLPPGAPAAAVAGERPRPAGAAAHDLGRLGPPAARGRARLRLARRRPARPAGRRRHLRLAAPGLRRVRAERRRRFDPFSGQDFAIRSASARYGPLALRANGTLVLGKHVGTDLVAAVAGPPTASRTPARSCRTRGWTRSSG